MSRLILLLAVLIMPLGMAPAQASSAQHSPAASMPMSHCPEQSDRHDGKSGIAECTMACAASLPASIGPVDAQRIIVCDPVLPGSAQRLSDLHPDTETPPPKRS